MTDLQNPVRDAQRKMALELSVLRQQGILIDLQIQGTGMFLCAANWSDIGIQGTDGDPRVATLTRGRKFLYPEEQIKKLRTVVTRMRQWLDRLSRDVPGFRPYHWMPYTAYDKWAEKWGELAADFEAVKQEFLDTYDSNIIDLTNRFTMIGEASWKSILAQGFEEVVAEGKEFDHDSFIRHVVDSALLKVPTRDQITEKLKADYMTAIISNHEELAQDEARAANIRAQVKEAQEVERLQSRILQEQLDHQHQMQRDELQHQQRMNYAEEMRLAEQNEQQMRENALSIQERELKMRAIEKVEMEHARQQMAEFGSPLQDIFTELRNQFAEDAETMLTSISKNGFVKGKIATQAEGLLEVFDLMATHDDKELREKLNDLKNKIGTVGERKNNRSTEEIISCLTAIKELSHNAAADFKAQPNRFAALEF